VNSFWASWRSVYDPIVDVCFNGSSFWVVQVLTTTLSGAITTLFGWLMLTQRARCQAAEAREQAEKQERQEAYKARDEAVQQRNEVVMRLNIQREEYRDFVRDMSSGQLGRRFPPSQELGS
jgi:type VI protein secretion system component VasK